MREQFARVEKGEKIVRSTEKVLKATPVLTEDDVFNISDMLQYIRLPEKINDSICRIVRASRPSLSKDQIILENVDGGGAGTRAMIAFARAAKARTMMRGSMDMIAEDFLGVSRHVLEHRTGLKDGLSQEAIDKVIKHLELSVK